MSLASIFDDHQVIRFCEIQNRIHIGHLTVQVHWDHSRNYAVRCSFYQFPACRVEDTPVLQVPPKFFRIHRVGILMNVYKGDVQTSLRDGFGRCDECVRHSHHDTSGLEPGGQKGEPQSICSTVYTHTVSGVTKLCELSLKFFYHWSANKPSSLERFLYYCQKFGFEFLMLRYKIQEWNVTRVSHFFSSSMKRSTLAGLPAAMALGGTSLVTTLPAPIMAFSPIVTLLKIVDPEPMDAPFFTRVFSTRQSASVCNSPVGVVDRG